MLHESACQTRQKRENHLLNSGSIIIRFALIIAKNFENDILTVSDFKSKQRRGIKGMLDY